MDILPLLFKQAIIAPNKLIGSQHYKRLRRNRILFTLTFHPHNHAVKSIILKNFKLLQNDPDTGRVFSQPPLISFKRDKNIGNFLVISAFKTSEQPGTFKCSRARCKTCPFIYNVEKLSGPKRSIIKITDHFTCTSANVIYCIHLHSLQKVIYRRNGNRVPYAKSYEVPSILSTNIRNLSNKIDELHNDQVAIHNKTDIICILRVVARSVNSRFGCLAPWIYIIEE